MMGSEHKGGSERLTPNSRLHVREPKQDRAPRLPPQTRSPVRRILEETNVSRIIASGGLGRWHQTKIPSRATSSQATLDHSSDPPISSRYPTPPRGSTSSRRHLRSQSNRGIDPDSASGIGLGDDNFVTPLGEYRRLGRLLGPNGAPVGGGMNEGIFLLKVQGTGQQLVEKRLSVTRQSQMRRTRAEIDALTRLLHAGPSPYINKIHESFFPGMTAYTCLILSFCEQGSLMDLINGAIPTSENFAWHVLEGITAALTFCHHGVDVSRSMQPVDGWKTLCHLDVKPDNVWLTGVDQTHEFPQVVLGDFGCSVTQDDIDQGLAHWLMLTHGTPGWLPPESTKSISGPSTKGRYGKATDIWQAGGTVQTLCRLTKTPDIHLAEERRPCGSTKYSRDLNLVVSSCMEKEVSKRPTAFDCFKFVRKTIAKLPKT